MDEAFSQFDTAPLLGRHFEPVVRAAGNAVFGDDHRSPDDLVRLLVFHHKDVDWRIVGIAVLSEGMFRVRNAMLQELPIARKVHRIELLGQDEQVVQILGRNGP